MILHITTRETWETAVSANTYHLDSLDTDGFIHCSTSEQVLLPANAMYQGRQGLVLLCINADKLHPPLIYEDCYETGMAFPHIYGPLNTDAVFAVIDFPPNADGSFSLPQKLPE